MRRTRTKRWGIRGSTGTRSDSRS